LENRRSIGVSSCNCGDGTDQRVQSLKFMMVVMMMMMMMMVIESYETLRRFNLKNITDVSEDRNTGMLYPDDEGTTVFRKVGNSLPVDTM